MNRKTRVMALILVIVMILALLASVVLPYLSMISPGTGISGEKRKTASKTREPPQPGRLFSICRFAIFSVVYAAGDHRKGKGGVKSRGERKKPRA